MNTGKLQATVAYRVTPNGLPVDINGQLISVSGRKQAIALLEGNVNPDPTLYEVQIYFTRGALIGGEPTTEINITECPVSIFNISPASITLYPGHESETVDIYASFGWQFVGPFEYATVNPVSSNELSTDVVITRTTTTGQGYMNFKDNATGEIKTVYVVNTDAVGWILETGIWNNLRFWTSDGIWNY